MSCGKFNINYYGGKMYGPYQKRYRRKEDRDLFRQKPRMEAGQAALLVACIMLAALWTIQFVQSELLVGEQCSPKIMPEDTERLPAPINPDLM